MKHNDQEVARLEIKIESLVNEVSGIQSVLPRVKQFNVRRNLGETIRKYQAEIQSLRREVFAIKF